MKKRLIKTASYLLGSIALGVIGNYVYDSVKEIPILGTITHLLKRLYELVTGTQLRLWAVLVLGVIIYMVIYLLKLVQRWSRPVFIDYTRDKFREWTWKWRWEKISEDWEVADLSPFCPVCEVELVDVGAVYRQSFKCPKCRHIYTDYDEPTEEIIRLIEAKANEMK